MLYISLEIQIERSVFGNMFNEFPLKKVLGQQKFKKILCSQAQIHSRFLFVYLTCSFSASFWCRIRRNARIYNLCTWLCLCLRHNGIIRNLLYRYDFFPSLNKSLHTGPSPLPREVEESSSLSGRLRPRP